MLLPAFAELSQLQNEIQLQRNKIAFEIAQAKFEFETKLDTRRTANLIVNFATRVFPALMRVFLTFSMSFHFLRFYVVRF